VNLVEEKDARLHLYLQHYGKNPYMRMILVFYTVALLLADLTVETQTLFGQNYKVMVQTN
jgi:hypothetical protein